MSFASSPASRRSNRRNTLIDALEARRYFATTAGSIDVSKTHQTVEGLGAASMAWWHAPETSDPGFYDLITNDLGASAIRGAIQADFEQSNDNADPEVFNWSKFDSTYLSHVMQFNQRLKERGVNEFFLTVWTPPWWMKTNQSSIAGGALRADMRAEFAEYLAAVVIASKRDFGIDVDAISIQNEQFFVEYYESAVYDNVSMRETVLAVQKKFEREGIKTRILANEDLGLTNIDRWKWWHQSMLDDDEIDKSRLIIGSHWTDALQMDDQAAHLAPSGVPLWYTEMSGSPATWAGAMHQTSEMADVFTKANATSYYYWLYNNAPWDTTSSIMTDGVPNAKYHGLKHFYRYVRPGMQRLETNIDETGGVRLAAFKDPASGAMTIVLVNKSEEAADVSLDIDGLGNGTAAFRGFQSTESEYWTSLGLVLPSNVMSLEMPANSVITLYNGQERPVITGGGSTVMPMGYLWDSNTGSNLRKAIQVGDVASVLTQLAAGANANEAHPVTGWTPLHAAAANVLPGSQQMIAALLLAGADVNAVTNEGFTPLHVAAMNQMIRWGTDFFQQSNTVVQLIEADADVNARDNAGRTPLMWAALTPASTGPGGHNVYTVYRLVQNGADQTLRDNSGRTAYDYLMQEYKQSFTGFMASGATVDTQAPQVRFKAFMRDRNELSLTITEDVSATLEPADVQIINIDTNAVVTGWSLADPFADGLTLARVKFNTRLPDGRYRMTIASGAFADQSGIASQSAVTLDFVSLTGDANGDGTVGFDDLLVLSQNYGKQGQKFSSGDFNGDGVVTFDDLLAVSQRYGTTLSLTAAVEVAAAPAPQATKAGARRSARA